MSQSLTPTPVFQACICGLLAVFMLLVSPLSFSHRIEYVVTEINLGSDHRLSLTHRFDLHDSEHAAKLLQGGVKHQNMEELRAHIATHIADNFVVHTNQATLDLALLGYEVEGKYLWVYQESTARVQNEMKVHSNVLFNVLPKQTHWINLSVNGEVQSASLTKDKRTATFNISQ